MSNFMPKQSKREEMEGEILSLKSSTHFFAGRLPIVERRIARGEKLKETLEHLLDNAEFTKENSELFETSLEHFMLVRTSASLAVLKDEQTFLIDAIDQEKRTREQLQGIYNHFLELEKTKRDAAKKET